MIAVFDMYVIMVMLAWVLVFVGLLVHIFHARDDESHNMYWLIMLYRMAYTVHDGWIECFANTN